MNDSGRFEVEAGTEVPSVLAAWRLLSQGNEFREVFDIKRTTDNGEENRWIKLIGSSVDNGRRNWGGRHTLCSTLVGSLLECEQILSHLAHVVGEVGNSADELIDTVV